MKMFTVLGSAFATGSHRWLQNYQAFLKKETNKLKGDCLTAFHFNMYVKPYSLKQAQWILPSIVTPTWRPLAQASSLLWASWWGNMSHLRTGCRRLVMMHWCHDVMMAWCSDRKNANFPESRFLLHQNFRTRKRLFFFAE